MRLNNKLLSEYGGILLEGCVASGCEVNAETFKGSKNSSLKVLNISFGSKKIVVPIAFCGQDRAEVNLQKSLFEKALIGKVELLLDDGMQYSAVLTGIGDEEYVGSQVLKVKYTFLGMKHGEYKIVSGNAVYCDSTLPYTDCILKATASMDAAAYKVDSVTFKNVLAGEELCVDGINGRILVNGVPAAERADWIEFPKLVPGINSMQCSDELTVEFYPVYF